MDSGHHGLAGLTARSLADKDLKAAIELVLVPPTVAATAAVRPLIISIRTAIRDHVQVS